MGNRRAGRPRPPPRPCPADSLADRFRIVLSLLYCGPGFPRRCRHSSARGSMRVASRNDSSAAGSSLRIYAAIPNRMCGEAAMPGAGASQKLPTCAPIELPTPRAGLCPARHRWVRRYHPQTGLREADRKTTSSPVRHVPLCHRAKTQSGARAWRCRVRG